ncbi:MAG: hypothetical protein FJY10_01260 [Bacteroidetes bacterium]|nr:hypothetical protein [Bacteroidota bacterium]
MEKPRCNDDLFKCVIDKATLKQEVYHRTLDAFGLFKKSIIDLVTAFSKKKYKLKYPFPFEYAIKNEFEIELKFGSDVLVFLMHTNVFEFPRDHEVMKISYIKKDIRLSYCGMIMIFNFLADSFRYNRVNDVGYMIGRVFVNRENHYFIEGKRELGLLFNNFSQSTLTRESVQEIVKSAILYTINFDLLTPPYDNMKEVSVAEIQSFIENMRIRTGKRLGFRFQADQEEIIR